MGGGAIALTANLRPARLSPRSGGAVAATGL